MTSAVPDWLRDEGLAPLWAAVRDRLERNGVEPRGGTTVRGLDRDARHAVGGLLGRRVVSDTVRLDLAELDAQLHARAGSGLVGVVTALTGPLQDRLAARSARDAARSAPFTAVRAWLAEQPDSGGAWTEQWLAGVRACGLLSRTADPAVAGRALVAAAQVAAALTGPSPGGDVGRNELAARVTGDAHALDDGSLCGALVVRALAAATGRPLPRTPADRRAVWEAAGVVGDAVSTTVLTLGLRPPGGGPAERLRAAADAGDPVHLTGWDLDRAEVVLPPGSVVLVCENPRVLEAVAVRCGGDRAVVCTAGMPATVALRLLRALHAGGAVLRYHGDFDWPGIAIANRLVDVVGVVPWRMSADDYRKAVRPDGLPLTGAPVGPAWDPALGDVMRTTGVAVHEEAVLNVLLQRLPELGPDPGRAG